MPQKTNLLALAVLLLAGSNSFASDDCARGPNPIAREVGQNGPSDLRFSYESRVERRAPTRLYLWCIESDKNNPNVGEFRWGDDRNDSRYLGGLIEPGRGLPSAKTDGSRHTSVARKIKFTRKNRENWKTIDTNTVTSKTIGWDTSSASIIPVQLSGSDAGGGLNLDRFKDEDGTIQVDRLSSDREAFVSFIRTQKEVVAGASSVITIPVREQIAELLQKNAYEKYNSDDFVRARAGLYSNVAYQDGKLRLFYSAYIQPDDSRALKQLDRLLSDRLVSFQVIPSGPFKSAVADSLPEKPVAFLRYGSMPLREITLGDNGLIYAPAVLQVSFGKGPPIASIEAPLFVPK